MKFENYLAHFEAILANPQEYTEYQDPEYLNYAKLNWSRMNRWLKKFEPSAAMKAQIAAINSAQVWTVITEPWCGDAGHSVPMLYRIAQENPHIDFQIHLRDAEPFLIDSYLTNGGKAIPKLIIRNEAGEDLAVWGPRPQGATTIFQELKAQDQPFEQIKEEIQKWYNQDKGKEIQEELIDLLK